MDHAKIKLFTSQLQIFSTTGKTILGCCTQLKIGFNKFFDLIFSESYIDIKITSSFR